MKKKALVIGYGITGRSNALALAEAGFEVTCWASEPAEQLPITSANAYAIWVPVRMDDARIEHWTNVTYERLRELATDPATGVELRQMLKLKRKHEERPWFKEMSIYRDARPEELTHKGYVEGFVIDPVPVIDPPTYLRWLHERLVSLGVKFEQREVESFDEIPAEFQHVVNCTGLGAKKLTGDKGLFAERVQVLKVRQPEAPWRTVIIEEAANTCFVPHAGYIKLGGKIGGGVTLDPDPLVTADIIARVEAMVPGFKVAAEDVLSVTCAFRPETASGGPRVELETLRSGRRIVHCYGHDGMGYLLSLGIAEYVTGLLADDDVD